MSSRKAVGGFSVPWAIVHIPHASHRVPIDLRRGLLLDDADLEREEGLRAHGRALIIDGHSFPDRPLPMDLDRNPERPDICIGTDPFHTPPGLVRALAVACGALGWTVAVDRPYAGTLVPAAWYRCDPQVLSVMIEVNRRLYLEETAQGVRRSGCWHQVRSGVGTLLQRAIDAGRAPFPGPAEEGITA